MTNLQTLSDKTAISLSILCTLHCLALPVILVLFPSMAALRLDNEAYHFWMILAVIPISFYALTLGCKQHKRKHLLVLGSIGLMFLVMAVFLPESLTGEWGEKALTLIGASIIAFAHYINYRLCRHERTCTCPKQSVPQYQAEL